MLFPLVTPEIVMGVSLLLVFTHVFTFIGTGTLAQILGHVTFSISFVVVIVRGRLFSDRAPVRGSRRRPGRVADGRADACPPAAPDPCDRRVGGRRLRHLRRRLRHQPVAPSGGETDTVPIRIYSATRAAPLPSTNAIATIMMVITLLCLVFAYVAWRFLTRGASAVRGGAKGPRVRDLRWHAARFDWST